MAAESPARRTVVFPADTRYGIARLIALPDGSEEVQIWDGILRSWILSYVSKDEVRRALLAEVAALETAGVPEDDWAEAQKHAALGPRLQPSSVTRARQASRSQRNEAVGRSAPRETVIPSPSGSSFAVAIGAFGFIVLVFGFGITTVESMPPNAQLFASRVDNTYISPPCSRLSFHPSHTMPIRARDVWKWNIAPDEDCRNAGGFVGAEQGILRSLIFPKASRWAEDGSWQW